MTKLTVGLIGAGAVGCFYAGHMAKKGARVTILTRCPEVYDSPICIDSVNGDFLFSPTAIQSIHEPVDVDVLILATKALPSIDQVALIRPFMSDQTKLMVIQNGIFVEDDLLKAFHQPIFRCLAFICVSRLSRTQIHHMDFGALSMGCLNADLESFSEDPLIHLLQDLDIPVRLTHHIQQSIWEKLVWNAPFNPLSVLCGGLTTEQLLMDSEITARVIDIMNEVQLAAMSAGVTITDDFIQQKIEQTREMAPYKTSMCLDYEAGLAIEVDAILGNLLDYADQQSVHIPQIYRLYNELKTL